jgi:hypothetical protein
MEAYCAAKSICGMGCDSAMECFVELINAKPVYARRKSRRGQESEVTFAG